MAMHVKYNSAYKTKSGTFVLMKKNSSSDTNLVCDYCKNTGHSRDKCFCLHGYPEWHKLHEKLKPKPRKLQSPNTKNAAAAHVSSSTVLNHSDETSSKDIQNCAFSETQYQQLAKMIQESIKNAQPNSWSSMVF